MQTGRFFHSTPADLTPGTVLTPAGGPVQYPGTSGRHVYLTSNDDDAADWALHIAEHGDHPAVHVYAVQPLGPTTAQHSELGSKTEHLAPAARVLGLVQTLHADEHDCLLPW